uniref:Uncharacterized protein n=1 Tax=Rousettus aegyptiacus TaxID=9407 RepID=A0A7J8GBZ0_ROUAE|nr:hypothetical protein HJG63_012868 [Rousettus aegyptiacus]
MRSRRKPAPPPPPPSPYIELLETTSAQEHPKSSEPLCSRDYLVPVLFHKPVSQESYCLSTCKLPKGIMYQQPSEHLWHFSQKPSPETEDLVKKKPLDTTEASSRTGQQTMAELESVLNHLEGLFAQTLVPQVLILLWGCILSLKELYKLDLSLLALKSNRPEPDHGSSSSLLS